MLCFLPIWGQPNGGKRCTTLESEPTQFPSLHMDEAIDGLCKLLLSGILKCIRIFALCTWAQWTYFHSPWKNFTWLVVTQKPQKPHNCQNWGMGTYTEMGQLVQYSSQYHIQCLQTCCILNSGYIPCMQPAMAAKFSVAPIDSSNSDFKWLSTLAFYWGKAGWASK